MRPLMLAALFLLPLAAHADDDAHCKVSQPRNLQLDFGGIDTVVFETGANDVDVSAQAGASGRVEGRACASEDKELRRLTLTQERSGRTLVVRAQRKDSLGSWFGDHYAYMKLRASVPDDVMVQLKVGSGDASLDGARAASVDTGSGDVRISRIRGALTVATGSGDVNGNEVGALDIRSIGSGDATFRHVGGAVKVGSIGSGDLEIDGAGGAVDIGSTGSGDIKLSDVGGSVTVGSIGSGDLGVNGVKGDLVVRSIGSGDIDQRGVTGNIDLPRKH